MSGQVKFAEITKTSQAPDDQLRVLRAVIDDGDLRAHGGQVEW
jgi:hypothetical protein